MVKRVLWCGTYIPTMYVIQMSGLFTMKCTKSLQLPLPLLRKGNLPIQLLCTYILCINDVFY